MYTLPTNPEGIIFPKLVNPEQIPELMKTAFDGHVRPVRLGNKPIEWKEYDLSPDMQRAVLTPAMLEAIHAKIGTQYHTVSWLNVYSRSEHIDWHYDRAGLIQIICVMKVPTNDEGQLLVRVGDDAMSVPLELGDALLFNAHKVMHRTTPIVTEGEQRMTATIRFLAENT